MSLRSSRPRAPRRTIAASCVLGLTATGAAVLGAAAPATAATLTFDCTVPILGSQTFPVDLEVTDATVPVGASAGPDVVATLTVPDGLADLMRGALGVQEISGQIVAQTTAGGAAAPTTLVIDRTAVPADGDVPLQAHGGMSAVTGAVGDVLDVAAGDQQVAMKLYDAAGEPSDFDLPCTPTAGQDLVFGSVEVAKASSTTKVSAKYAKKAKKATVVARVASDGPAATGKVAMVLKKGKKTVGRASAAIKKGVAKATFKVKKKGAYTVVATYRGTDEVTGSRGTKKFSAR